MAGKTAFIFPGQGSQHIGMAKDLFDALPDAKAKFAIANDILGFDLAHLCFEGPEEELKQTNVTQPAIFVHSCIVLEHVLAGGKKADMVAGHSLGEYTALVAAGALSFEDALQLVKVRGDAMQGAGLDKPGTMAALLNAINVAIQLKDRVDGGELGEAVGLFWYLASAATGRTTLRTLTTGTKPATPSSVPFCSTHSNLSALRLHW